MKKYIFAAAFSLALLASPAFTQAAALTQAQINAIVSLLQSFGADQTTINNVQASLGGGTTTGGGTQPWCHTFNTDLTIGSSGDDVSALYTALERSRVYTPVPTTTPHVVFDEDTAGYVVRFQAKYGIPQTGLVGPITRAKLNSLYGCSNPVPVAPNKLQLTIPNNGEKWQIGSVHTIQWTPYNPQSGVNVVPTVSAYLERQVNGSFVTVGKVQEDGKASIHWSGMIGDTPQQRKNADPGEYYIRIVNSQTGEWDRSDVPFTLVAQNTIKVDLKINGLDTSSDAPFALPTGGGEVTLSWTSLNADICRTYFYGLADDVTDLPSSGQKKVFLKQNPYTWVYGISLSCSASIGDARDAVYIAAANGDSQITVLSPNGGESINPSSVYPITWTSSKDIANVAIALYMNDSFYRWIAPSSIQSTGSLSWNPSTTLPSTWVSSEKVFKIYMIGYKSSGGTVEDKSDAPFSIVTPPPSTPSITATPIQVSTGGLISQKLHYAPSSNSFYGIGSDNAVWKWNDSAKQWSRITDGSIKDDFHFISESEIYGIGLDGQIWKWNGIRWSQESQGGKIQHKIWYVDGNHIYGIGMDNQVWRYGSAGGWVKITSNGQIKDDFHFVSESEIYGIGTDGQIWKWNGTSWNQHSSGGAIKQRLHVISSTEMYGIGADNKIWGWSNGIWSALHDSGQAKDDFVIVGGNAAVYAIGLDNQIWKLPPRALGQILSGKTFATLPPESFTVGGAYSNPGLAGALGAFSGTGTTGATTNQSVQSTSSFSYAWNRDLQIGSPHQGDIVALQQALAREGVYGGEITGGFYSQTYTAVQAFQRKHGINATGYVGLLTRAKLNEFY